MDETGKKSIKEEKNRRKKRKEERRGRGRRRGTAFFSDPIHKPAIVYSVASFIYVEMSLLIYLQIFYFRI